MPEFVRIATPIAVKKLTCVMQIRGTDVFVHWSVFLIAIMLSNAVRHTLVTRIALIAYLSGLLIHEAGHLIAAQSKNCKSRV